ncbi:MAG: hypothetical protein MUO92_00795 [Dehalococcoidales bacterium]|nr:hypothetical protein [Dehalococcoidales bacterium]
MAFEYFYLVFIASVGVIQAAVAYNGFRGISFFSRKIYGYLLMVFTLGPVLVAFFAWNERNITGVIEGREQFYLFMLAIVTAIGFTLVLSSLLKHWSLRTNNVQHDGFEALKEITFFQALRYRFLKRR